MPRCRSSTAVTRVSSAAMTSTVPRMSMPRSVRSRRFPSGVATTYNVPGSDAKARGSGAVAALYRIPASSMRNSTPLRCRPAAEGPDCALARAGAVPRSCSLASGCRHCPPRNPRRQASSAGRERRGRAGRERRPRSAYRRRHGPTALPIVLVLPLASAAFGRAAEAVKAGFLAAAEAARAKIHGDRARRRRRGRRVRQGAGVRRPRRRRTARPRRPEGCSRPPASSSR